MCICSDERCNFLFTSGTDKSVSVWRIQGVHEFPGYRLRRLSLSSAPDRLKRIAAMKSTSVKAILETSHATQYSEIFSSQNIDTLEQLLDCTRDEIFRLPIPQEVLQIVWSQCEVLNDSILQSSRNDQLVHFLSRLISIETISVNPEKRGDGWTCAKILEQFVQTLGAETRLRQFQSESNPILVARIERSSVHFSSDQPAAKIVIYSHYDVVPVFPELWSSPPFTLTGKNGYFYGRGSSDNKGPIAAFLFAIKELIDQFCGCPLDVVFIFDGEGERDSFHGGFEAAIHNSMEWLSGPTAIVFANTVWAGQTRPCINYGMRGLIDLEVSVHGPKIDLHAGVHGGAFHEPMTDLIHILGTLANPDGTIQIPGFYDQIRPISAEELAYYENICFDITQYRDEIGVSKLRSQDPLDILMKRWRSPCLTIHSIESTIAGYKRQGSIISKGVRGKVSIRIVPDQTIDQIIQGLRDYLDMQFASLDSGNTLDIVVGQTANWWLGDPKSYVFAAASAAIEEVWQEKPVLIREGGTMATSHFLSRILNAPAIHLPFGQATDQAHLENERIRFRNLLNGRDVIKAFGRNLAADALINGKGLSHARKLSELPQSLSEVRLPTFNLATMVESEVDDQLTPIQKQIWNSQ